MICVLGERNTPFPLSKYSVITVSSSEVHSFGSEYDINNYMRSSFNNDVTQNV